MDRQVSIALINFKDLREWQPKVGDVIVKHGFITRTKWFGVVNFIRADGSLDIIRDGMMRLLVQTPPEAMPGKTINLSPTAMKSRVAGSYTVLQNCEVPIWYV